jgi:outer membrane protein TolC
MMVDTLRLTLDEAVDRAMRTSPALALERRSIDRAAASRLASGGFFPAYPSLEFEGESDAPFRNEGEVGWGLKFNQEIDLSGSSALRRDEADVAIAEANLNVRSAELLLRRDVVVAFARVVAVEDHLASFSGLLSLARRLDSLADQSLTVGEISELDRNTIRIERIGVEVEYVDLEGELESRRLVLQSLVGLPPNLLPVTVGPRSLGQQALSQPRRRHIDSLLRVDPSAIAGGNDGLLAKRPELQALERERERADLRRSLALGRRLPGLTLGVGYRTATSVLDGGDIQGSESIRAGFGRAVSTGSTLGLHAAITLPLPFSSLYDRGDGDVAIAEAERAAVDAKYRLLLARFANELQGAQSRARTALSKLAIFGESLEPLVRRNIDLLERGYSGGELDASEVVIRQESMLRAMRARIDAQLELDEALADLEFILE